MWAKLSSVLKPRGVNDIPEPSSSSQASNENVMSKVFEQHPNLSVFHGSSDHIASPSPPPSPTRSTKRSVFRRLSKATFKDDSDSARSPSPMIGQPKKIKAPFFGNNNNSQASLSKVPNEPVRSPPTRRSSHDMLRPSKDDASRQNATISSGATLRRPSLDLLRQNFQDASPSIEQSAFGSVRSILRDPNTPGTGQNVRFFSRDAYKVISPDQSMEAPSAEAEFHTPSIATPQQSSSSQLPSNTPLSGVFPVRASSPKAPRPTALEVFSSMSIDNDSPSALEVTEQVQFVDSSNTISHVASPNFTDIFDLSHTVDLPKAPPGLGFDVPEPIMEVDVDMSLTDDGHGGAGPSPALTSTPFKDKGKGKATDTPTNETPDNAQMHTALDISLEKPSRTPSATHERSHSFSFGQTVFHSLRGTTPSAEASSPVSSSLNDLKKALFDKDGSNTTANGKSRSRALSDTTFQSMLRSPSAAPEAEALDPSFQDFVVCASPEQPDPFRANATTYYTPQTMIPVTPPQGAPRHARKTSKEDSVIFSLQTQLALQTELCQQYENDLRSRDELVEILGKKLNDVEKEDVKRRSILRTWKKKVQELEKTCRYLEDEVEGSRQSSMERSIMDEASGEALRMLHRQISVLEKEKAEWTKKEETLREEATVLESLVKERTEVGNISGVVGDEELKKLLVENQAKSEEERERHRIAEFGWEEERTRLTDQVQHLEADKSNLEANLENTKLQLQARDEEYNVLKAELDAQWENTERASEKFAAFEKKVAAIEEERDALHHDIDELNQKIAINEAERDEIENRKEELETQVQEMWDYKEEIEKEKIQLDEQLQQERNHSESLTRTLQEHEDRISQLDQERLFSQENVARLEDKLRQRDEEETGYSEQAMQREAEVETLREEMTNLRREHAHAVEELQRSLQEASIQEGDARAQLDDLVRQQATSDIEMRSSADKIAALKEEVENQRRKIQVLQQESADKEVKLAQLNKQHQRDKEDLEGMNTALDSKQMELELIKRNLGVRGTGGATPAPASRVSTGRRDSTVFNTPGVSRPSSSMSDTASTTGRERKRETPPSAIKISTLGKSVRPNGTASSTTAAPKRVEGSMGPPPAKSRSSLTPTPTARVSSLSRSNSTKPSTLSTSTSVRRVASASLEQSKAKSTLRQVRSPTESSASDQDKENVDMTATTPKPGIVPRRVASFESQSRVKSPLRQVRSPTISSVSEQEEKENVDTTETQRRRSVVPTPA